MLQAVGQVRAARTIAIGAIVATGIGGIGLWIFQQTVGNQKRKADEKDLALAEKDKKLEVKEHELIERVASLDKAENNYFEAVSSLNMRDGEMMEIDKFVNQLCKEDDSCLKNYNFCKEEGRKAGLKKFREKMDLAKKDAEVENSILRNKQ